MNISIKNKISGIDFMSVHSELLSFVYVLIQVIAAINVKIYKNTSIIELSFGSSQIGHLARRNMVCNSKASPSGCYGWNS